jgi:hypothetical protein
LQHKVNELEEKLAELENTEEVEKAAA